MPIIDGEHVSEYNIGDHAFTLYKDKIWECEITEFNDHTSHEWNVHRVKFIGDDVNLPNPTTLMDCQLFHTKKECIHQNIINLEYKIETIISDIQVKHEELQEYRDLIIKITYGSIADEVNKLQEELDHYKNLIDQITNQYL